MTKILVKHTVHKYRHLAYSGSNIIDFCFSACYLTKQIKNQQGIFILLTLLELISLASAKRIERLDN